MTKTLLILLLLAAYVVSRAGLRRMLTRIAERKRVVARRSASIERVLQIMLFSVFLICVALVAGRGYHELPIMLSSVVALFGVALFAYWSILSNLTASLIIYFAFPYRVGDKVRIIETENLHLEGRVEEIALFHVVLRQENGDVLTYPNTLILQRAVIKVIAPPESEPEPEPEPSPTAADESPSGKSTRR